MACIESSAIGIKDLFDQVIGFLTNPANFSGGNQWEVKRLDTNEAILMGKGNGDDEIYVGLKIEKSKNPKQYDLVLNGYGGFDPYLEWHEQPGSIWHEKLPVIPLAEMVFMNFWLSANSGRFILVVEMSSQYESAYVGLMKPVGIDRQYPYPLVVAGSYIQDGKWMSRSPGHSAFVNPGSDTYTGNGEYKTIWPSETGQEETSSFRLRRPDGVWRSAMNVNSSGKAMHFERLCLWPYNTEPKDTYVVYHKSNNVSKLEDNMMYPVKLYESHPVGNIGVLDGVYFVGNRVDLAAKDSIIYKDRTYRVFNNVYRREDDAYFAIEWG